MKRIFNVAELKDFFSVNPPDVSFEFFPPKTAEAENTLWETITRLQPLSPTFVGVTYGAGGSTRERTHRTVKRIVHETNLKAAAHLTCAGATKEEIDAVADGYWQAGVRHIVALRGDPPKGTDKYEPFPGGYPYAADLIAGLKKLHDFKITVAAFPEGHPESKSLDYDMEILKRKIDVGAQQAITQYFFNAEDYYRLLDRAEKHQITIPIIPGIMPVTNAKNLIQFSKTCGASIPQWLADLFEGLDNSPEIRNMLSMQVASSMCLMLHKQGISKFHFFTMNRSELTWAICRVLGIKASLVSDSSLKNMNFESAL